MPRSWLNFDIWNGLVAGPPIQDVAPLGRAAVEATDSAAEVWVQPYSESGFSADHNTIVGYGSRDGNIKTFVAVIPGPASLAVLAWPSSRSCAAAIGMRTVAEAEVLVEKRNVDRPVSPPASAQSYW
jgi:hypothetical protein